MAGEKKRRGRRAHLNDFYRDVAGNYVYTGTCYVCRAAEQERTALLRRLWLLTAVLAAAVLAGGCISAPGMDRCFYVLLPYAAEVGLTGSVVWAMTRWQAREYPMREYVYHDSVEKLPGRALVTAVFAAVALAGEVLYLFRSGGSLVFGLLFLLLMGGSAAAIFWARRTISRLNWSK